MIKALLYFFFTAVAAICFVFGAVFQNAGLLIIAAVIALGLAIVAGWRVRYTGDL